jgi:hypothetical protein
MEERMGNLAAVALLLLTSGFGAGLLAVVAVTVMHPSFETVLGLLPFIFFLLVVFGFAMTAINYAAMHGVREHARAQRERQQGGKHV